jgi:hypothetical protein
VRPGEKEEVKVFLGLSHITSEIQAGKYEKCSIISNKNCN